jgi:hypothetical protein
LWREGEKNPVPLPGGRAVNWTLTNRLEWRRRNALVNEVLHQLWVCEETGEKNDGQFHIADRAIEANPMVPGIFTLQARIAELTTTLESQDKQLMHSLSISGLEPECGWSI